MMKKLSPAPLRRASHTGALLLTVLSSAVLPGKAQADADDDASTRFPETVVIGQREKDANPNANPNAPYKVEKSANDKFTEPLRDTPKSVTAIPKEVIEDVGATSFREVVRATPGVTLGTGEGGNAFGDRIFIRGFEARNDVYIDGLRDPGVTSREVFAVEQIEIVKGPSSSFGGRGTTGGAVSLQSKRPTRNDFIVGEAGIGSENYYRATVDANLDINKFVSVRVNTLYQSADTPGRDFVDSERFGATASVQVRPTEDLTVTGDYYFARLDGIPDFGHPFDVTTQRPYKVDRENFYGVIGRDFLESGAHIGTLNVEYQASDTIKLRSVSRYGRTFNRYIVGAPGAVCRFTRNANGSCPTTGVELPEDQFTVTAGGQRRWADNKYVATINDATLRFDTAGIGHTVVTGMEYARETVENRTIALPTFVEDSSGNAVPTPTTFIRNLLNPNPVLGFEIPHPLNGLPPSEVKVRSFAGYLIDTIKFTPQWQLLLGVRYDSYNLSFSNPNATGTQPRSLSNKVDFFNYQASLVYKPVVAATLYASFSTSSNPSGEQLDGNGISYDGISAQTEALEPERNKSYEVGAKYELFDGELLLTAAVFQITKSNARENIGNNVFELVGKLRSRGAEFGVNGNVGERLQLFGGYSFVSAEVIESAIPENVGRRFANIPQHSASLLATYRILDSVQVGGQVYWQDEVFGGTQFAGTAQIPGYARFDAVARWKPTAYSELRLNVLNLTNKTYYDAIYRSSSPFAYVAPGRSATLNLTLSF